MSATAATAAPGAASGARASSSARVPPPRIQRRRSYGWVIAVVVVLVITAGIVGIGSTHHWFGGGRSAARAGGCPTGFTLQGSGAGFVQPVMGEWIDHFDASTGNTVNYPGAGSGTGITDLTDKSVDFAVTDEPLSATQQSAIGVPTLTLPVAGGALAVIYHVPGVAEGLHLSGALLADIYLGKITSWNDPAIAANNTGVNLPNAHILTVHRQDGAGTTYVLTDYLSEASPAWAAGPGKGDTVSWPSAPEQVGEKGNSALLTEVESTTESIGYSDLTDVLQASSPPTYAAMLNPSDHFVLPTVASTNSAISDKSNVTVFPQASQNWYRVSMVNAPGAGDYPLATFAYGFVVQAADHGFAPSVNKTQAILEWMKWVVTTGQGYNAGLDYTALSPAIVGIDEAGLSSMTYNGAAVPACG